MSYTTKAVAENLFFYSLQVDPIATGAEGNLSIANGRSKTIPTQPQQKFTFSVDDTNSLTVTGQTAEPAPAVQCMSIASSGAVNMFGNVISNAGTPQQESDVATKEYVDNAISGGGTNPNVMTNEGAWSSSTTYSSSDVIFGSNGNYYMSLADNNIGHDPTTDTTNTWWRAFYVPSAPPPSSSSFQCVQYPYINVAGPTPIFNTPVSLIPLDTSSFTAGKSNFTVYVNNLTYTVNAQSSIPASVQYFITDTNGGAYLPLTACLFYTSTGLVNGTTVNTGPMTFTYSGTSTPPALYLAIEQTTTGAGFQINNAYCKASMTG